MAGEPAVLLLMEEIHLVYSTYCLFAYSEPGQGVITAAVVEDIEIWHLLRHLTADDIIREWTVIFSARILSHVLIV